MRKQLFRMIAALGVAALVTIAITPLYATAPTGAIFTTTINGSEVDSNNYPSKDAVYLDGGPGMGAPQTAAGLDDGIYVFQVTDPSGKTLLSTDAAKCRQFTVLNGIITGVVITGCQHATGADIDHGAVTVQLMRYNDTPNSGGEYKVWATKVQDFIAGCSALGVSNGLDVVDCGGPSGGDFHGFVAGSSKTDNFHIKARCKHEIDTSFIDNNSPAWAKIDGLFETWIDTLGASNIKWSYHSDLIPDIAHVEAVEGGTHHIVLNNQTGCTITQIGVNGYGPGGTNLFYQGPQTLSLKIKPNLCGTLTIVVYCNTQ